jgi:hypothetical protein
LLMKAIRVVCLLASASFCLACRAPDTPPRAAAQTTARTTITDTAPVPRTTLLGGLGAYHREIRTASAEAQRFFDEGLNLLYGFNHEEAFASFGRAATLDPRSPMPHWGMALALGTNINDPAPSDRVKKAFTHLADAVRLAPNGSPTEQGLVTALTKRYVADPVGDPLVREQSYSAAMGALSRQFPNDADVATLYAESMMNLHPWKLYKADGAPESWTPAIVATLERVLARYDRHPGANHYYVHAVEASAAPSRAAAAAARLESLVPGAGHLVHMPSHIYIRTGLYAKAAQSNAAAAAVDEAYFRHQKPQSFYAMSYYGHNLQFESAAAMYGGNFAEAQRAAQRTVALEEPMADQMAMLEPFAAQELLVLARFGKWNAILSVKPPPATRTIQLGLFRWARGAALVHTGNQAAAEVERDSLRSAIARVPKDAMVGPVNWGGDVLAVAVADLTGRLRQAAGDSAGAIAAFTEAVTAEDRLGYNEPPDWLFPERERLGVALLAAGKPAQAERVFRADLTRHVGNPRSLYGVFLSLEARRNTAANAAKRAFDLAWQGADVVLGPDLYPRR